MTVSDNQHQLRCAAIILNQFPQDDRHLQNNAAELQYHTSVPIISLTYDAQLNTRPWQQFLNQLRFLKLDYFNSY